MSLILVVDDHYPMRVALEELLKQMGHDVLGAKNGKEALAIKSVSLPTCCSPIFSCRRWTATK